jgi:hypothetical protein
MQPGPLNQVTLWTTFSDSALAPSQWLRTQMMRLLLLCFPLHWQPQILFQHHFTSYKGGVFTYVLFLFMSRSLSSFLGLISYLFMACFLHLRYFPIDVNLALEAVLAIPLCIMQILVPLTYILWSLVGH